MKTTPTPSAPITTLSELEVRLFSRRPDSTTDASAFITAMSHRRPAARAPVKSLVPQPPQASRTGGVVESVLLRVA